MRKPVAHTIQGQRFWFSPDRCVFWEEQKALILADMYLGKHSVTHAGTLPTTDLERLLSNLFQFKANRIIIIGEFAHSLFNKELALFKKWRNDFPHFQIDYIRGLKPVDKNSWLLESNITIHKKQWSLGGFSFRHFSSAEEYSDDVATAPFVFSGHLRPCIRMSGTGNKALRLPCFYITDKYCLLPSFGKFICKYSVEPAKGNLIFVTDGFDIFRKD